MDGTKKLQSMIEECSNLVFFGGAGVSTESGIPDFRSVDGLYHQKWAYPPEQIVSHSFFMKNPEEFYRFYKEKLMCGGIKPNAAHRKLAELEKTGKLKAIVTQNIDNLHQMAGSQRVLELHGSVYRNYCTNCHAFYDFSYVKNSSGVPHCEACGHTIKPDVVLYEEALDTQILSDAVGAIAGAEMLIIGGTSLAVYPAASLIDYFKGKYLVVLNKEKTPRDSMADLVINGPIGEIFSQIRV